MNTDKLVPIDFSRNITPFVMKDTLWNDMIGIPIVLSSLHLLTNANETDDVDHLYVISYADRPNTGKQPVADDVVVDVCFDNEHTGMAGAIEWSEDDEASTSHETWKLNHAEMVKRYQATLADKEDERMNNIARNGNDGDHYDVNSELSAIEALERFGYKYENGVWSQPEVKPELAAYMEPHVKDSSIERLGVFLRKNELVVEGEGVIDCVIRELAEKHDIDIRTDQEKLRDAIGFAVEIHEGIGCVTRDAIIGELLSSDKFTITLKGK